MTDHTTPKPRTADMTEAAEHITRANFPGGFGGWIYGQPVSAAEMAQKRESFGGFRSVKPVPAFTNIPMEEDSTISSVFTQGQVDMSNDKPEPFSRSARQRDWAENLPPLSSQRSARARARFDWGAVALAVGYILLGATLGAGAVIALAIWAYPA